MYEGSEDAEENIDYEGCHVTTVIPRGLFPSAILRPIFAECLVSRGFLRCTYTYT